MCVCVRTCVCVRVYVCDCMCVMSVSVIMCGSEYMYVRVGVVCGCELLSTHQ